MKDNLGQAECNRTLALIGQSITEYSGVLNALEQRARLMLAYQSELTRKPVIATSFTSTTPIDEEQFNKFTKEFGLVPLYISGRPGNSDGTLVNRDTYSILNVETRYDKSLNYSIYSFSKEEVKKFLTLADLRTKSETKEVHMLTRAKHGWKISRIGPGGEPLIKENYSPKVLESFDYIAKTFSGSAPPGRLVILYGEPGTGKTYFIRGLLDAMSGVKCLLIPARYAVQLEDPNLLSTLLEDIEEEESWDDNGLPITRKTSRENKGTPFLLIVEDADEIITNRTDGNTSSISALLNMADGIFGSLVDVRIIATTNAKEVNIDSALLRPGRLLDKVSIEHLEAEEANKVYARLTGKKGIYTTKTTLSKVYADAGDFKNKGKKEASKKIGF